MRRFLIAFVVLIASLVPAGPAAAETELVSVELASRGPDEPANAGSQSPDVSSDGNTVVFVSWATNLVAGDTNGTADIFAYDITAGTTTRVSVASDGIEANAGSEWPSVSGDGTKIAFLSTATNLVADDTGGRKDIFVHDTTTGTTVRITGPGGIEPNYDVIDVDISADGSKVVYSSYATNLVAGDTNGTADIFVYDIATESTNRISMGVGGSEANGISRRPVPSRDGSVIVFYSFASNLVFGDTNEASDIFIWDATNGIRRVSKTTFGTETNHDSYGQGISENGTTVVFDSYASNMVPGLYLSKWNVFAYDVTTDSVQWISATPDGSESDWGAGGSAISGDGSAIAYTSRSSDLLPGITNEASDVFTYDTATGETTRVSLALDGSEGNDSSDLGMISRDGGTVVYISSASNLVAGDSNGFRDIFVGETNRPPSIADQQLSIPESSPVGQGSAMVTATDPDGDSLEYTITAGDATGLFTIDSTGAIDVTDVLDFETLNQYTLTVTVSDGSFTDDAVVTITVTDVTPFSDADGSVFENDIEWLAFSGITKGCNPPINDQFCPAANVTRSQMAAFLVRALDLPTTTNDFFEDDDGTIFEAGINRLAAAGITKGCNPPDNTDFCPDGNVTRGQMAAFLVRALGYTDDGGGDLFTDDNGSIFEDAIDKLATAGVTRGCNPPDNTDFCPDGNVTRGQMAAFLHRALG